MRASASANLSRRRRTLNMWVPLFRETGDTMSAKSAIR